VAFPPVVLIPPVVLVPPVADVVPPDPPSAPLAPPEVCPPEAVVVSCSLEQALTNAMLPRVTIRIRFFMAAASRGVVLQRVRGKRNSQLSFAFMADATAALLALS
jgi:hypothetical protein